MIVTGVIIITILIAGVVPKRGLKTYFFLSGVVISSLYFFFVPFLDFDLSRHYQTVEYFKNLSLLKILSLQKIDVGNYLVGEYTKYYPVYCIYVHFIGRTGIKELLAVITGIIVYGLPIIMMCRICKNRNIEKWKLIVVYSFIVFNIDFLSISGVRNILAATLFAYILYLDLIEKKNKIFCFICYICICFIHSMGVLLLFFRILLFLYAKKFTTVYTNIIFVICFFCTQRITEVVIKTVNVNGILGGMIYRALNTFILYSEKGTESSLGVQGTAAVLYILCFVICIYFEKYILAYPKYKEWCQFIIIIFLYSISAITTRDVFMRFRLILFILMIPVIIEILNEVFGKSIFSVSVNDNVIKMKYGIGIGFLLYLEMIFSFVINIYLRYSLIDDCFIF